MDNLDLPTGGLAEQLREGFKSRTDMLYAVALGAIILTSLIISIVALSQGGEEPIAAVDGFHMKCLNPDCRNEYVLPTADLNKPGVTRNAASGMLHQKCPICGKADAMQQVQCPKCGNWYLSAKKIAMEKDRTEGQAIAEVCPDCGTDREEYLKKNPQR